MMPAEEPTTVEDDHTGVSLRRNRRTLPPSRVQVDLFGQSNQGKVRHNNEDHFLIARFGRFLEKLASNLPAADIAVRTEESGYGMIVADGVGGSAAGEEASRLAIGAFVDAALSTPDWILLLEDDIFAQEVMRRAAERYRGVNDVLSERADADPSLAGFATTMTMALTLGADAFVAHVGDSRAYRFHRGTLTRLTHDHTAAQDMADHGIISEAEVATNRLRHVLTRVIGAHGLTMDPDVTRLALEDGDCLLLCTDGLTEMVKEESIASILAEEGTAESACGRLIREALNAGGKDNVTVIVARYRIDAEQG